MSHAMDAQIVQHLAPAHVKTEAELVIRFHGIPGVSERGREGFSPFPGQNVGKSELTKEERLDHNSGGFPFVG